MAATVFASKVQGPATHALVVAVGHYPHLPGGGGKVYPNHEGMRQLKSPPESGRAIARWLIEAFDCPERPLASVALLISEKAPVPFTFTQKGKQKSVPVETATVPNAKTAVDAWYAASNSHADNLMLFYFCGHGIANATDHGLLMSDFGANPLSALDGAVDFRRLYNGMDGCLARHQCYFIDACRVASDLLIRNAGNAGRSLLDTPLAPNPGGLRRLGPTFYSTLAGAPAYAAAGKPSVFATALLEALGGAGAGDEDGPWQVKTLRLQEALGFLMTELSRELKMPQAQVSPADGQVPFALNTVQVPKVPVLVRVLPDHAHPLATLRCESDGAKQKRAPKQDPWRFSLPVGRYNFFADFKNGKFKVAPLTDETVRPPYWRKPLKVSP